MIIPKPIKRALIASIIILTSIIIIDAVFDLSDDKKITTISKMIRFFYTYTGGFFCACGFLLGHLGWYGKKYRPFVLSMSALIIFSAIFTYIQMQIIIKPIWYVLPGIPLGHVFWPQKDIMDNN